MFQTTGRPLKHIRQEKPPTMEILGEEDSIARSTKQVQVYVWSLERCFCSRTFFPVPYRAKKPEILPSAA